MFAHPLDEIHDFAVAPHPGREPLERRVETHALRSMSDIAVDRRRIRPIRFHRHDREPVFLDQATRDGCAGAVEFRRAVACLSEQHDPPPGKAIEKPPEGRIVEIGQRLGRLCNHLGQRGRRSDPCPGLNPLLMPAIFADERHESDPAEVLLLECRGVDARDLQQPLLLRGADGYDEMAAEVELLLERMRYLGTSGSDQYGGERSSLGPAGRAVADTHIDIAVTELGKSSPGDLGEAGMALDRIDMCRDPAQHRRRITGSGPDFEHRIARLDFGAFDHQRHDIGLRDGLAMADREGRILIGEFLEARIDECLPRDDAHRLDDVSVPYPPSREMRRDHPFAGAGKINHGGSLPCVSSQPPRQIVALFRQGAW